MHNYLWVIVIQQLKKLTVAVICLLYLSANIGYAELGKKENGAIVENTTHVHSKINPKAGDFLWEIENKPSPKYASHFREAKRSSTNKTRIIHS